MTTPLIDRTTKHEPRPTPAAAQAGRRNPQVKQAPQTAAAPASRRASAAHALQQQDFDLMDNVPV